MIRIGKITIHKLSLNNKTVGFMVFKPGKDGWMEHVFSFKFRRRQRKGSN